MSSSDYIYNYIIIDIETNLINKSSSIYKQSPKYILGGTLYKDKVFNTSNIDLFANVIMQDKLGLIGHNIGFDILVTASQHEGFRDYVLNTPGLVIWDTAVYEYMLSGQTMKYPSLAECAKLHNLPISKEDTVSTMIHSGIDPESILEFNPELLHKYLTLDLQVTEALFKSQMEAFGNLRKEFCNLVIERQKFLLNTIRMSIQGMPFDVIGATNERDVLKACVDDKKSLIEEQMQEIINLHCKDNFVPPAEEDDYFLHTLSDIVLEPEVANCNSVKQLRTLFFGGTLEMRANGIAGVYKSGAKKGEPKYKTITFEHKVPGLLPQTISNLDDTVLADLEGSVNPMVSSLAKSLRDYRVLSKKLSTYYDAYIEAEKHGRIHCDYNHTATPTGRITSCKPNLQNVEGE